jgi:hypothetical protein
MGAAVGHAQTEVSCVDGKGQVLINPYYNITNPLSANYIRIVNTSGSQGVGVKVRLRRATDSQECFNFYLCLSAQDMWSGWILPNGTGGMVVSGDSPNPPETPTYPDLAGLIPPLFLDPACQEGYVEIVSAVAWSEAPGAGTVSSSALCQAAVEGAGPDSFYPNNVLIGDMHLLDADRLTDSLFAYNSTALADFRPGGPGTQPVQGVSLGIDSPPTYNDADGGVAAVDAALAKTAAHVINTSIFYDRGVALPFAAQTDFIVLFPTKSQSGFGNVPFKGTKWDNAEHTEVELPFFSPEPAAPPTDFPYELNYVRIGPDGVDTIFQNTPNVYWGNFELLLMSQALLDLIQRDFIAPGLITDADLAAVVPAYANGHLYIDFLGESIPAIVVKFQRITDASLGIDLPRYLTNALEAQYDLP